VKETKIQIEKKRKQHFKRKPNESSISRFLQFNLPDPKSLKPSVNKTNIARTIMKPINDKRLKFVSSSCGNQMSFKEELATPEQTEYGNCQVIKSGSGHYIIFDSTKGHVELWITHPELSYIRITNEGKVIIKSVNNIEIFVENDLKECILGQNEVLIEKDKKERISGSQYQQIDNEKIVQVGNNFKKQIGNNEEVEVSNNRVENIGNNVSILVGKSYTLHAKDSCSISAKNRCSVKIGSSEVNISGGSVEIVSGSITIRGNVSIEGNLTVSGTVSPGDCRCCD